MVRAVATERVDDNRRVRAQPGLDQVVVNSANGEKGRDGGPVPKGKGVWIILTIVMR